MSIICVYKITNISNGKVYIGQTWDLNRRWNEHKIKPCNDHLKKSFDKYKIENFKIEPICTFKKTNETQLLLNTAEDFFINYFNSTSKERGYNKKTGGSNGLPIQEVKEKISKGLVGHKVTEECRLKMGRKGKLSKNFGRKHNEAFCKKNSENNAGEKNGNSKKVKCVETGEIFSYLREAAAKNNIPETGISMCCNKKRKTSGGYHWEFVQ